MAVQKYFIIGALLASTLFASSDGTTFIISGDTTLTSSLFVPDSSILTIAPGSVVKIDGYLTIRVEGVIIAEGTSSLPIFFIPVHSDQKQVGPRWKGVEVIGKNAQAIFRHCRIEGVYRNLIYQSEPLFDSCEFLNNHYAIYCTKKAKPHIKNCVFRKNKYGIASDNATPILLGNVITNNTIGLYLQLSSQPLAGKNVITDNDQNIRSEMAFGSTNGPASVQQLWEIMQQLYR